jgi:hypothetical protein
MSEWVQVGVAIAVPVVAAIAGLYKMLWDIKSDIRILVHDAKQTERDLLGIKRQLDSINQRVTALEARRA